jgi:hypothetical protein
MPDHPFHYSIFQQVGLVDKRIWPIVQKRSAQPVNLLQIVERDISAVAELPGINLIGAFHFVPGYHDPFWAIPLEFIPANWPNLASRFSTERT